MEKMSYEAIGNVHVKQKRADLMDAGYKRKIGSGPGRPTDPNQV